MTTEAQWEANRTNSQKSTGPRTPEGKANVSRNALKHGLLSQRVVLEDEDEAEFEEFRRGLLAALDPAGELEQLIASRVVASAWRLARAGEIEQALLTNDISRYEGSMAQRHDRSNHSRGPGKDGPNERSSPLGLAVIAALSRGDRYGKLSRYEAHIERGLYRALHELQRLQTARAGPRRPLEVHPVEVIPDEEPANIPDYLRR